MFYGQNKRFAFILELLRENFFENWDIASYLKNMFHLDGF